nr:hypothetical protein [Tanacetum cinerariifolium]
MGGGEDESYGLALSSPHNTKHCEFLCGDSDTVLRKCPICGEHLKLHVEAKSKKKSVIEDSDTVLRKCPICGEHVHAKDWDTHVLHERLIAPGQINDASQVEEEAAKESQKLKEIRAKQDIKNKKARNTDSNKGESSSKKKKSKRKSRKGSVKEAQASFGKSYEEEDTDFVPLFRDKNVTWVNQTKESGLPYDIILEANDKSCEYIEVKTTSVADKKGFYISQNELSFASEMGASFIFARVELSDGELVRITTYNDLIQLLRSKKMKLVLLPC